MRIAGYWSSLERRARASGPSRAGPEAPVPLRDETVPVPIAGVATRPCARSAAPRVAMWLAVVAVVLSGGCVSGAILSVDDVVFMYDRPMLFVAHVEREPWPGIRDGIDDVEVVFQFGRRPAVRARTNAAGRAEVAAPVLRPAASRVSALARVDGKTLHQTARVFHWDPRVPVLVVDVDETICWPAYLHIALGARRDVMSQPVKGSRAALRALAHDFNIMYISARPRFLLDMTRQWLATHGYPPGPMVTSQELSAVLAQSSYKRTELARLRQHFPNMLIGIGDKAADIDGFRHNGMLSLIVGRSALWGDREHTIALRDWPTLLRFIRANQHVLSSCQALSTALRNGRDWQVTAVAESQ